MSKNKTSRRVRKARRGWVAAATHCALCGKPFGDEPHLSRTLDHIIPLSRGGSNLLDNVRVVHRVCNRRKGGKLDEEMK